MIAARKLKEPVTITAEVTPEVISVLKIHTSVLNPRKTFDDLKDLDSMATVGLIHPLKVRPSAQKHGQFEIVCGERRFRKALALGWEEVRCEVQSLTDNQSREIMIIENLSRKDVPPLEEANAFATLITELNIPIEELAKRIGRSTLFIRERMKLLDLCIEARTELSKDNITLGVAGWLCRLVSADDQRELLPALARGMKRDQYSHPNVDPAPIGDARRLVLEKMRRLEDAPFDIKDAALTPGSCLLCTKNTGCQPELFPGQAKKDASCTDGACWQSKVNATNAKKLEAVKAKGLPILEPKPGKDSIWEKTHYDDKWRLKKSADVVDVEDTEYHQGVDPNGYGKNLKWAEVVKGRDIEIKMAVDDGGHEHQVVSKRKALELVKEYAKELKKKHNAKSPAGKAAAAKAKMPSLRDRVNAAQKRALLEAVARASEKKPYVIMRERCHLAMEHFASEPVGLTVARRRGLVYARRLEDLIARTKDVGELAGILAELITANDQGTAEELEGELGIDVEQLKGNAEEEETERFAIEKQAAAIKTKTPAKATPAKATKKKAKKK